MNRRRLISIIALVSFMTTSACATSNSGDSPASSSPPTSAPLAPWAGSLASDALPVPVQSLNAVACPTPARCWAVGSTTASDKSPATAAVVATTDGGRSWKVETVPATVEFLSDIACPSPRVCVAVGQSSGVGGGSGSVLSTQDAGTTWTPQTIPTGISDVTSVDCRIGGRCIASAVLSGRVTALSAPTPSSSWVTGGPFPSTVSAVTGLSCTDSSHCWASGTSPVDTAHMSGVVAFTADGGTTWALQSVPNAIGVLSDISCTAASDSGASGSGGSAIERVPCTAVGTTATSVVSARTGQGVVLTTSNGGSAWTSVPVTATSAALHSVTCDAGPCVAAGTTVASSAQAGIVILARAAGTSPATWRKAAVTTVAFPLTGVACRSLASCVVVGESITAHLSAN